MKPLTPKDVQSALDAFGLNIRVQRFNASTATSLQAADAVGTELGSIVKSLCFFIGEEPVIVLGSGDQRMDERKIAALRGVSRKRVRMATAAQSVEVSGYAPGGVPPLGHRTKLPIYIDDMLTRYETVYAAAGAPDAIFPITFKTLVEATGGAVADIAKKD